MFTTAHLQKYPAYYDSVEECKKHRKKKDTTFFVCTKEYQFEQYRKKSSNICQTEIKMGDNVFSDKNINDLIDWSKYKDATAEVVLNTFKYMFYKMKKGIYIKIENNEIAVFLPFDNENYTNEWSNNIKIDPQSVKQQFWIPEYFKKDPSILVKRFLWHIRKLEKETKSPQRTKDKKDYYIKKVKQQRVLPPHKWRANNCILRFDDTLKDTGHAIIYNMFQELCQNRKIPDIEIFVNRRDFPVITRDGTEPYYDLFGTKTQPLLSHNYDKYCPILSMVTTKRNADIPIPTGDDWSREQTKDGKYFSDNCMKTYNFDTPWEDKKPIGVFRGGSTGCGVTIDTNPRLKLALLAVQNPQYLDAGITKWNLRSRKLMNSPYLQTIDLPALQKMGIKKASFLSPEEQSKYKYIVHVDGHVSAFRLGLEMSMGCCILKADSQYKMWFGGFLKAYEHYVPIREDLSDLIDKIKWCRENDDKCREIAGNAKEFYQTYLQKDGIMDYLQNLLINIKQRTGEYVYNTESPIKTQINREYEILPSGYPKTTKNIGDIGVIPIQGRYYGNLKGLEWLINMVKDKGDISNVLQRGDDLFKNVFEATMANYTFAVKTSDTKVKILENKHEAFVGLNCINEICKLIPNFVYIFGIYENNDDYNVIMERVYGKTLKDWITNDFSVEKYIFILVQICLALQMAQEQYGFVHNDLTPWNIMISKLPQETTFDYLINGESYRITTDIIPIMIDYGKSHVVHKNVHHGFINPYKSSSVQDLIILLNTSVYEIIKNMGRPLDSREKSILVFVMNFISNTKYRQEPFKGDRSFTELEFFLRDQSKYSELVRTEKYELEQRNPMDFVRYIIKSIGKRLPIRKIAYPSFRMNKGNPRQVFDYILAKTDEEKIQSYIDVFTRVMKCELPLTTYKFISYFTAQSIYDNLSSVHKLFEKYIKFVDQDPKYLEQTEKVIEHITELFSRLLEQNKMKKMDFNLKGNYKTIEPSKYDENTFLNPFKVLDMLKEGGEMGTNFVPYKNMIVMVFSNNGKFKLSEEARKFYKSNFEQLLSIDGFAMQNNSANYGTLLSVSEMVYKDDLESMRDVDDECGTVVKYREVYGEILKKI